jgi:3',5'-cyclic AMP phosphodiesterase CpdA
LKEKVDEVLSSFRRDSLTPVVEVSHQPQEGRDVKIVFISDTHNKHRDVMLPENIDILVHSGDFTLRGREKEIKDFSAWLGELKIKHKIVIAGNHDLMFEDNPP